MLADRKKLHSVQIAMFDVATDYIISAYCLFYRICLQFKLVAFPAAKEDSCMLDWLEKDKRGNETQAFAVIEVLSNHSVYWLTYDDMAVSLGL